MRWTKRWAKRLRALTGREGVDRELDEEFAHHLEMEVEHNLRAGMSPEEARRRAVLAFGHVEKHREEVRDARWVRPALELTPDLKLALRMLVKHPALSVVGGLGMAVAIAVAVGFYTFMAAFYYSVPPLDEGERVVALSTLGGPMGDDERATLFDYHVWSTGLRTIRDVGAFTDRTIPLEVPGAAPKSVSVAQMTASGFRLARVRPLLGRPLLEEDERDGAARVLVIGEEEWRRELGGDAGVIGREVRLAGTAHTVVGVMPAGFRFPSNHGYWIALGTDRAALGAPGEGSGLVVFGRMAPGVGRRAAQAEISALHARLAGEHPAAYEGRRSVVVPYARGLFDLHQYPAWSIWLMQLFAALVLTLIAVNVAVLVYARTASRRAELTVRTALGATRRRIVSQLFIEALALSALAAGLGLALAQLGFSILFSIPDFDDSVPYWVSRTLPLSTILYAGGLAVLAAFVVGAVPGLQATGRRLQDSLRQMGGATGMGMGSTWTVLIVAQVAIAVAVLPAVVAIAWNSAWAPPVDPTFPAHEILSVRVPPRQELSPEAVSEAERAEEDEAYAALQAELIRTLEAEPAVTGVTYSRTGEPLMVQGGPGGALVEVPTAEVDVRYFEVLGLRLLAGRALQPADRGSASTSVVVSRTLVDRVFAGENPVGRSIRVRPDSTEAERAYEVVGVVEEMYVRRGSAGSETGTIYFPGGVGAEALSLAVRVRGVTPAALLPRAEHIARTLAPEHNLFAAPMGGPQRANRSEVAFLSLVVSLITLSVLLLSAAGVSAMMSFAVTRRQREIGIRSALGASRGRILRSIFAQSARQVAIGLLIGAGAALLLDRLSGGEMLSGQELVLPPLVAALMVVAGAIATLGPARRALRIQPMEALRLE